MSSIAKKLCYSIATSLLLVASTSSIADQMLDRVAAIANDKIILQSELDMKTRETAIELNAQNIPVTDLQELQAKVLDSMILELLQKERAEQLGLSVTDEEVNEQLFDIASKNDMTILELRDRINEDRADAFVELRNDIQQQLVIQKLRQREVISRTMVTDEEVKNF